MTCKKCSNIFLSPKKKLAFLKKFEGLSFAERKVLAREILGVCQKVHMFLSRLLTSQKRKKHPCRMCGSWNGTVTKVKASFLFLHIPWESSAGIEEKEIFKEVRL